MEVTGPSMYESTYEEWKAMNRICGKGCRYFDAHTRYGNKADCRAGGNPPLKDVRVFRKAIMSVSGGHETATGKPCPYDGPYTASRSYQEQSHD